MEHRHELAHAGATKEVVMFKRLVVGAVMVVSCADESGSSTAERGASVQAPNEECAVLTFEQCKTNAVCRLVSGAAVDETKQCLGERAELGCIAAESTCDEALTTFEDTKGAHWVLNDSCGPKGFASTADADATSYSSCADNQQTTPSECAVGTEMFSPGCGTSESAWEKGCYTTCSAAGNDSGCAAGFTCQKATINPCVPKVPGELTCEACGQQINLCLAAPEPKCTAGTEMFSPGCGPAELTWSKGCYAACNAVGNDTGCAAGFTCQETWINPCVPKPGENGGCAACGAGTTLCLAAPAGT